MFEKTYAMLDHFLELGIPGIDLVVYQDGQEVLRCFRGTADKEGMIPMTGKERYAMYSMSKPITCTCAMQLWEKGMFSLEDPLADYLPEFAEMTVRTEDGIRPARNRILVKNLFEMTAGLNYDVEPWMTKAKERTGGKCPTREAIRILAEQPLDYEPGESWKYSLAHDVLACLVEVISGQRYADYVKANIFDPLNMHRSTFSLPQEEIATLAPHYTYKAETGEYIRTEPLGKYRLGSDYDSGGAGLISTIEDYIRFAEALRMGNVVLKKETIQLMATDRLNALTRPARGSKSNKYGYGLGVRCPMAGDQPTYTDFGWGGAAGSYMAVDIPRGLTFTYTQHVLNSPTTSLRSQLWHTVADELLK